MVRLRIYRLSTLDLSLINKEDTTMDITELKTEAYLDGDKMKIKQKSKPIYCGGGSGGGGGQSSWSVEVSQEVLLTEEQLKKCLALFTPAAGGSGGG